MEKKHYYLVSGQVIIDNEGNIQGIPQNALITNNTKQLTKSAIGRAQQALQVIFFNKMDNANIKVIDVIINGLVYLGVMTDKEFQETDKIQEMEIENVTAQ